MWKHLNLKKHVRISPLARKIALDHNIELENVVGTGHNGKIMRDDILKLIAKPQETEDLARHEKAVVAEEKSSCTAGYRNRANDGNEKSYFKTYDRKLPDCTYICT